MSALEAIVEETNPYAPENPAATEWDVAVVGTGMGGATVGFELARLGRKVLFIEKGLFLHGKFSSFGTGDRARDSNLMAELANTSSESAEARLRAGQWPTRLQGTTSFGQIEFFAPVGCGSGGSTILYAAALERFAPSDFRPRANFPRVSDSALPVQWPIGYEDLRPYYERAEELFQVRGTPDPLAHGGASVLRTPPSLGPRDQHLLDSLKRSGMHPYQVHVGCEFVEGCKWCLGACPRGCKNDAARICLVPALEKFGASLLSQCEVLTLEAGASEVREIRCRWKGRSLSIRAKTVVLAAGAFMTPALLLNSNSKSWPAGLANGSGLVGRNLMFHVSDFFAVSPRKAVAGAGLQKNLALNDFYFSEGEKLGTFQSVGGAVELGQIMQYMREVAEKDPVWWRKLASPRPIWWRKLSSPAVRLVAMAMYHAFNVKHAAVWASIVEDLPYNDNRIIADPRTENGLRFEYRYTEELKNRVQSFRRRLAKALAPHKVMLLSGENNLNFSHVCGTCRFGDDPGTSVLDKYNRAHDLANLYVVDASFFPSSGGTNPSLTIAANALRVASAIAGGVSTAHENA